MALSFAFDSKTETPETVKRRRQMVDALMSQMGTPDTYGEGIAAIGQGLVAGILNNRANKAETAGRAASSERFSKMFGGGGTGYGGGTVPKTASGNVEPATVPQTVDAQKLRQGMIDRGLPEHVADGFLMNFQDESGLNAGINEKNPTVAGSRGGYGLYQLTGPRRVAYEQYAAGKGVSPDNPDAQLDFLMTELQGPEADAAKSILASKNSGEAAAAIARDFLRPAKSHLDERVARYTAGGGIPAAAIEPTQVASLAPDAGVAQALTAQAAQNGPDVATQRVLQAFAPVEATAIPPAAPGTVLSDAPRTQTVRDALLSKQLSGNGQLMPPDQPVQVAQVAQVDPVGGSQMADASQGQFPPAPATSQQGGGFGDNISTQQLLEMANDPWATDTQRSVVGALLERRMAQSDPAYQTKQRSDQLGLEKQQLEVEQLRKGGPRPLTPAERQQWGIPSTDQRPYAMTAKGPEVIGGSGQTINIGGEVEARKAELARLGIGPDDPRYAGYALTGKMPREDAQDLTATDKKAILEADEMVTTAEGALPILKRALELSPKAYDGMGADWRGWIAGNAGSQAGKDTMEFDNLVQTQALSQLKAIFGAAPTEGERKILLDIAGSSSLPADVRKGVLERAQQAVERRLDMYKSRAENLRGGTFYKPGEAKADASNALPDGVTEEDIQHTMQVHGLSRDEVLKRLQNAP